MDLKELEVLGDAVQSHWYYRSKAAALRRLLRGFEPSEILDIGAGSGFFSRNLLDVSQASRAVCVDIGYDRDWDETEAGKPISFRRSIESSSADLALAMDVLEHVDSESDVLRPYVDLVNPGTLFAVTVPAFEFLWSGHDEFLGHRRRYTVGSLVRAVQGAGLAHVRSHYYYGLVFPLAALSRLSGRVLGRGTEPKSQLRRHSAATNAILLGLCTCELPLMRFNRLFGLSVMALFRKP